MPLSSGTRLGVYEIVAPVGAGGMGEVYKARDLRLNRFVALKVLPGAAALDPERRERFEREAQAIAALNHPNIVTIYSVERLPLAPGADIDVLCLAMELVEGRPLADALPATGLPLDRLLKIAIPVVDATAAAHQKGITHRDLKPANIMLGEGEHVGRVKVLDFGLAKLAATMPAAEGAMTSPTGLITGEGRILGTAAYMSPEQAEGKAIDARSDLFSLGVILYEMATGRRPFTGDTSISIISSIVKDTPTSVTELNPSLPPELGRIIRRALMKDPERRYQTAKDLRNDLEELKTAFDSGDLQAQPRVLAPSSGAARFWRWTAIGVAVLAMAAIAVLVRRQQQPPAAPASQPSAPPLQMTRLTTGVNASHPAISPDGKYVAYVQDDGGQRSVWVHQIASNSNVRSVDATRDVSIWGLTVTPDGGFVDFVRQKNNEPFELWRAPFLGGPPRRIAESVASAPGWSPDGKRMAFLTQNQPGAETSLVVAEADGAQPRTIATCKVPRRYVGVNLANRPDFRPIWMPDGQSIAVMATDERRAGSGQLVTVNVGNGVETELLSQPGGAQGPFIGMSMVMASDRRSFIRNAGRGIARIEDGKPTRLVNDLDTYLGVSLAGDALVTARQDERASLWLTDGVGNNPRQIAADAPSPIGQVAWAGIGRLLHTAQLVGGQGIWSIEVASGARTLIVRGAIGFSTDRDGKVLVFQTITGGRKFWRADVDGSHAKEIPNATGSSPRVTPDGRALFYHSGQSGVQSPWVVDLNGGEPRQFASMFVSANSMALSPDGRFIALQTLSGDKREIVVMPTTAGPEVRRLSFGITNAGIRWTPDGRGIAYVDQTTAPSNLWVQPIDGGPPRQLTHFTDRGITGFDWSPDGQHLALAREVVTSDIVLIKGVR